MGKDYLAMVKPKPEDRLDYGVRGMRWGVTRTLAALKSAAAQRSVSPAKPTAPKTESGPETSQARYARLMAVAKSGKSVDLSDDDLKFFNARTEALRKIEVLNQTKPGWITTTASGVLQKSARKSLQSVTDAATEKYITDRLIAAVKKQASDAVQKK